MNQKRWKQKLLKQNKKQVKASNKKNSESKLSERLEKDGVDYEKEFIKRNKLEIESRIDKEYICVKCDKLNRKIVHAEIRCDALVE